MFRIMIALNYIFLSVDCFAYEVKFIENNWKVLSFDNIKTHKINFLIDRLEVLVDESAAPLIYKFEKPLNVKKIELLAGIQGQINFGGKEGDKSVDDAYLRLGLIIKGDKKLNFFQRAISPRWVKELYEVGQSHDGVDKILFLTSFEQAELFSTKRSHDNESFYDEVFAFKRSGDFISGVYELPEAVSIIGLWLSSDGDNTNSKFVLTLSKLYFYSK